MRRSFSYRVAANKFTIRKAEEWLVLSQRLYNAALEQRIFAWKQRKQSISLYDQINQLPELRSLPEYSGMASEAMEEALKRLDRAYQNFFRRVRSGQNPGFPRFKSKDRYDSFSLRRCRWKLNGRDLEIKGVGRFRLFLSQPIQGTIKQVTIRRSASGKWFVSFSCDEVPVRSFPVTKAKVGIDVGIKSFAVDSDGVVTDNPKHLKASLAELRRKQRALARRIRGSARRNKARIAVGKVHEKVSNQRKDFLHKLSNHYVRTYGSIYIEDLKIQNMIRNRHLARSIADSSWGMFFTLLSYKAEEAGRELVRISPNGTSQLCSSCGEKVPKVLSVRVHSCLNCGLVLDRDHNAALNVLRFGQNRQAVTSVKLADVA